MLVQSLAAAAALLLGNTPAAAALLPFGGTPAVDGATTLYASFDDERQPRYGFIAGEPFGDAEPVADGRHGGAWRFARGSRVELPLAEEAWRPEEGTLEFWLRPGWEAGSDEQASIISLTSDGTDRLYVNRDRKGRFGVAILGGTSEAPRWVRTNLPAGSLRPGEWSHVAVIWSRKRIELRLDEKLVAGPVFALPMDRRPTRLTLGRGEFSIDELRVSDIARYPGPVVEAGRAPGPNRAERRHPLVEEPENYSFALSATTPASERFRLLSIDPASEPPREQPANAPVSVAVHAARGEREPARVVIYALADLGGVELRVRDAPVDGLGFEVRRVVRSPMRRLYNGPATDTEVIPRFLVSADRLAVPRGEFLELWLTFEVPLDAPAGRHAGSLELNVAGSPPTGIPLELEVHPFSLPDPTDKRMGLYYKASRRMIEPGRLRAELADMRSHGVTDLVLDFQLLWQREGDAVRVVCPGLERFIDEATAAGFERTLVIGSGLEQLERLFDGEDDRDLIAAARVGAAMIATLDDRFPGEIAITHLDEVFNEDRLEPFIELSRVARVAGYPRIYATFHTRDAAADGMRRRIAPFVDIRGHHGFTFEWWLARGHRIEEYEAELRAAGDEAWLYHNVRGAYFPPIWARLINGLYLRASPFVLNAPWIYQDYRGNPYDDADASRADLGMAFPEPGGTSGLAPTLVWEQMREGRDDLRTLALLEALAQKNRDRFAEDLAWLDSLDRVVREARVEDPTRLRAAVPARNGQSGIVDLDTGLRVGIGRIGTRGEAPLIDALSRRFDGAALDAIRLEAARRIRRILEDAAGEHG